MMSSGKRPALNMIVVLPAAAGAMLPADAPCQLSPPPPPAVPARPRVGTPPEPQPEPEPATAAAPTEQPKSFARPLPPVPAAAAAPLPAPAQQVMAGASYKLLFMGVVRRFADMDSDKVCKLDPGEVIIALGSKQVGETTRVRFDRGWVSVTSKTGTLLLERTAGTPPEPEPEPAAAKPGAVPVDPSKVKFKGKHLDFLRNMAAARKQAQGQAADAVDAEKARRQRLQAKVLGRCKEVATEALGALPPQQQALVAAQAANMRALGDFRAAKNSKKVLSQSMPRPVDRVVKGGTKTSSLNGRSCSAGGTGASGGTDLLNGLGASREQALFSQSVRCGLARCGADCKCDGPLNLAPPPLDTSGSRGRQRAVAAQKQVGRASVVFASDVDASWNVQQHSLQRRLTATNLVEAKAAFLEDPTVDPIFEYEHDIEGHQLERFPVCKRWVRRL